MNKEAVGRYGNGKTFEEIKSKIESSAIVSITEIKEIQYGKCISLNNGAKVNCFDTGKYNVQGRAQEEPFQ